MRIIISLAILSLILSPASSQEIAGSSLGVAKPSISIVEPLYSEEGCNISASFSNSVLGSLRDELNLSDYAYSKLSNSYCYAYDDYTSFNLNFVFKKSESDFVGRSVSVSVYSNTVKDFDSIFTKSENEVLGYNLKEKYADFLINGTDEEYYVSLSPKYSDEGADCDSLKTFFDSLSGEKYFDSSDYYCSAVVKTATSNIRNLVSDSVGYVYYFGDKVYYTFTGFSYGSFDLSSLSQSMGCDFSNEDYYYPEIERGCYGIYKKNARLYLSAYREFQNASASVSVYGISEGRGRISVSLYGLDAESHLQETNDFVAQITAKYFGTAYKVPLSTNYDGPVPLRSSGEFYSSLSGVASIDTLNLNVNELAGFNLSEYQMNKYYQGVNISVSVSEPYIQVRITEPVPEAEVVDSEKMILPPYYSGRTFVITSNRVYSSVTISENDAALAESEVKGFIDKHVQSGSWRFNMSVTQGYYYPFFGAIEKQASPVAVSADLAVASSGLERSENSLSAAEGAVDSFSSEHPDFSEFEEDLSEGLLSKLAGFLQRLFGIG